MSISDSTMNLIKLATVVDVKHSQTVVPAVKDDNGKIIKPAHTVNNVSKNKHIDNKVLTGLLKKRGSLYEALSKMRAKIKMPPVDQGASFPVRGRNGNAGKESYTYSSLASLIDAVDKGISDSKSGLSFTFNPSYKSTTIQKRSYRGNNYTVPATKVYCSVRVADQNGWAEDIGQFSCTVQGQDGQSIGGGLTYARRYALSSALGVSGKKPNTAKKVIKENGNGGSLDEAVAHDDTVVQSPQPTQASKNQIQAIERGITRWAKVDHLSTDQPYSWLRKTYNAQVNLNSHTIKITSANANKAIRDIRSFVASKLAEPADKKHVEILNHGVEAWSKSAGQPKSKIYKWLGDTYHATVNTKTSPVQIKITNANYTKAVKAMEAFISQEKKSAQASAKSDASKKQASGNKANSTANGKSAVKGSKATTKK